MFHDVTVPTDLCRLTVEKVLRDIPPRSKLDEIPNLYHRCTRMLPPQQSPPRQDQFTAQLGLARIPLCSLAHENAFEMGRGHV